MTQLQLVTAIQGNNHYDICLYVLNSVDVHYGPPNEEGIKYRAHCWYFDSTITKVKRGYKNWAQTEKIANNKARKIAAERNVWFVPDVNNGTHSSWVTAKCLGND